MDKFQQTFKRHRYGNGSYSTQLQSNCKDESKDKSFVLLGSAGHSGLTLAGSSITAATVK